jgi:hypothetical protein
MTLYAETVYYCNLGEPIKIIPTTIKNISFINCKYLPSGLLFTKRDGVISGIYTKEDYLELQIKYRKNTTKVISEVIKISIKKREPIYNPDLSVNLEHIIESNENEPITYYLTENDSINEEIPISIPDNIEKIDTSFRQTKSQIKNNIEEKIKKSINDLSLTKTIKFMCINETN